MNRLLYDRIINVRLIPNEDAYVRETTVKANKKNEVWIPGIQYDTYVNSDKSITKVPKPYLAKRIGRGGITEYKYATGSIFKNIDVTSKLREVAITCPAGGIKPDISVKFNIIPGDVTYSIEVRIKNLHLTMVDIRKYSKMIVDIGYQSGIHRHTSSLVCTIEVSYQESPGPDGVTLFKCITVGSMNELLNTRPIKLIFNKKEVTLEDLVRQVSLALHIEGSVRSNPIAVRFYVPEEFKKQVMQNVDPSREFDTGKAVVNWLQTVLNNNFFGTDEDPHQLTVNLVNDEMIVFDTQWDDEKKLRVGRGWDVIELDRVMSANFDGPLLTVTAPYIPHLFPNTLFRMTPNFFTGATFLNTFQESIYRGEGESKDIYKVITMSVEFATVGDSNTMTVTALPVKTSLEKALQQRDDIAQHLKNQHTTPQTVEDEPLAEQDKAVTAWYEVNGKNLLSGKSYYQVKATDYGLSTIAEDFYAGLGKYPNKPVKLGDRKLPYPDAGGQPRYGGSYWWPLIALATYEEIHDIGTTEYKLRINLRDPNFIRVDDWLVIPTIKSVDDFETKAKQCKEVFKQMALVYNDPDEQSPLHRPDYAKTFANIYVYLGGTWS